MRRLSKPSQNFTRAGRVATERFNPQMVEKRKT